MQHKRALVTGCSRGIGAAIVKRLAQDRAHVALSYVSRPDLAQAACPTVSIRGSFPYFLPDGNIFRFEQYI